jgi:tetratricopeptide (TPR) repeat protein
MQTLLDTLWLIIQQLDSSRDVAFVAGLMSIHIVLSGLLAALFTLGLPSEYKKSYLWSFVLLFATSVFTSEIGLLFLFIGIQLAKYFPLRTETDYGFESVELPEFSIYQWNASQGNGLSGVRERISQQNLNPEVRIQSLMALQQYSSKVATRLIGDLLSDNNDDIRLLAFGILDGREKKFNHQITDISKQLDAFSSSSLSIDDYHQKSNLLQRLGELYWELVYEDLVQGDLRQFSLRQAERYTREALSLSKEEDAIALFQLAKILNAAGRYPDALRTLQKAMNAGLSKSRAKPYLAEIAYNLRRYDLVRQILCEMKDQVLTPKMRPLVSLWSNPRKDVVHV